MRTPWYASGDLFLPKQIRSILETYIVGDDKSLIYITLWSIMHGLSGVIFYFVSDSFQGYLVIHTVWELWQIYIGMTPLHTIRGIIDIITDTIMGSVGFLSTRYLVEQRPYQLDWFQKSSL
jgi:hypothetical protein